MPRITDDERILQALKGPKTGLFDELGTPVLDNDGRLITGWLFIVDGKWKFIADVGMLQCP